MQTALITGGAKRIGKQITKTIHQEYNVIIHYNSSATDAKKLQQELNAKRNSSAQILQADLNNEEQIIKLCSQIDSLDLLVNNASVFYPTTIKQINVNEFDKFMHTNVLAPLLLGQKLYPSLKEKNGNIVNIVDIHALRPLKDYIIYNISKAGIYMLTQSLAKELAPEVRVNGVSPGSILWPENNAELDNNAKEKMLNKIALNKQGSANDIAETVMFLATNNYITGQIINVDGGRTLHQ
jgi:pteridine reductase